ncbi:glycerate kinase [Flavimobilis sp. GY10621]|uniref:Glycerate kinase n=1 Tax=Flavimobilis rhizosphaerae TaxID=2775421 RepID=A0ABR9DT31_9MICO|nr:glycerate kinase [Flavimobilis rhizosphaerae]MBD9700231.1 glycerate kinase [Flavimobilis rhizosphaerae]
MSVDVLPLADGRSGTAEALAGVRDVVVLSDATLVAPGTDRADAVRNGSSRPLGTLLASALTTDARTVLVALGADAGTGTAWADGGAGMLVGLADGLGVPVPDSSRLVAGGAALRGVTADDLPDLGALRRALAGRDVRVAHRAPDALLGLGGLAGGLVPDVLDAVAAQDLERALGDLVHAIAGARAGTLVGRDLLGAATTSTTSARAISDHARELGALRGGAAGGGAALALAALGVPLAPAAPLVADLVGVTSAVAQADLVVVVVPVLDGDESHDGVLPAVADAALDAAVPVVVLAGTSLSGRREWSALGVAAVHETGWAVPDDVLDADGAVADEAAERVARIARTWRL